MISIIVVITLSVAGAALVLIWAVSNAVDGYEDGSGFHPIETSPENDVGHGSIRLRGGVFLTRVAMFLKRGG